MEGIALYDLETQSFRTIMEGGTSPTVLNDNRHLITTGDHELYVLDTVTGDSHVLLDVSPDELRPFDTSVSADNRLVYYGRQRIDADIWLLTLE